MKKILVVGLVIAGLSLLISTSVPVLAHGPENGNSTPENQEAWKDMYEACVIGDWETMVEAAEEVHSDYSGYLCHDYGYYTPEGENTNITSGWGGMMGGRWGGMMSNVGGMIGRWGGMMNNSGGMMGRWSGMMGW